MHNPVGQRCDVGSAGPTREPRAAARCLGAGPRCGRDTSPLLWAAPRPPAGAPGGEHVFLRLDAKAGNRAPPVWKGGDQAHPWEEL